jgi:quinol monooxygenase YgiN
MTRIAQFAKFSAKPGRGTDVVAALEAALAAAVDEPGTEAYAIHVQADNPDVVWMYELYSGPEAQAAHSGSEATGQLRGAVADLLEEPLTITRGALHDGFGVPAA